MRTIIDYNFIIEAIGLKSLLFMNSALLRQHEILTKTISYNITNEKHKFSTKKYRSLKRKV